MSEPILSFIYNHGFSDIPYGGIGGPDGDWKVITTGIGGDTKVYTGGGILGTLSGTVMPFGTRDATVRPGSNYLIIPQVYIEDATTMYEVPLARSNPNTNRYVFGVYINGYIASDLYIEMWDDNSFSTTNLPTLSGTSSRPWSMFNCYATTSGDPSSDWNGETNSYSKYLAGTNRLGLKGASEAGNETVYFNMYVALPYDAFVFHDQPIETYRYLYI